MSNRYRLAVGVFSITLFTCAPLSAETFHVFDPATLAQGSSGVAVADPATATLMNPAALAAMSEDSTANLQGSGIVRAFDEDELVDSVDDFQDANYVDRTDRSVLNAEQTLEDFANNNASPQEASESLQDVAGETRDLNGGLESVTGKPAGVEVSAAVAGSVPGQSLGIGVAYSAWGTVTATTSYDDDFLTTVATDLDNCAEAIENGNESDCDSSSFIEDTDGDDVPDAITLDPESDLESRVFGRGIAVQELGVTFARAFDVGMSVPLAVGVTPKAQKIEVFDYVADVNSADEDGIDASQYTRDYSDFNADIGALAQFDAVSAGVTVRNVIPREYETALDQTIDIEPQARAGVAYDGGWYRLVSDLDLTRNDSVGFTEDQRFVSLGGTISIVGWAHLRAGYRVNTAGDSRDVASVGLGLSPFRTVHVELAAAGNADEVGGGATLAATF